MPRAKDIISKGILGQTAVTLATKGYIVGLIIEAEVVIPDGITWDNAQCFWDTTTMFWDYARSHACIEVERLIRPSGGGIEEMVIYVPFEPEDLEDPEKLKKYIKLTIRVAEREFTETKEINDKIQVTPKDVEFIIKEALIKLEIDREII